MSEGRLSRNKGASEIKAGVSRFTRLLGNVSDEMVVLLKGHLLIEEALEGIVEAAVEEPKFVREARLTFAQRLRIARAVAGHLNASAAWDAAEALNAARNKIVHLAEPPALEGLLRAFTKLCDEEKRFWRARELPPGRARLVDYLGHVWAIFAALGPATRALRTGR